MTCSGQTCSLPYDDAVKEKRRDAEDEAESLHKGGDVLADTSSEGCRKDGGMSRWREEVITFKNREGGLQ